MSKTVSIQSVEEVNQVVDSLLAAMSGGCRLVLLYGDLGAGKTTLVKELAKTLGTTDDTSSPTYGLVNEYEVTEGIFYHIDLYRIEDTEEALDMGIEHYIYSDQYCCVEWPQVIEQLVEEHIRVDISASESAVRTFVISKIE